MLMVYMYVGMFSVGFVPIVSELSDFWFQLVHDFQTLDNL